MNGYNPNYFNRQTVDSMKSALTQVLSERFPGTEEGQPGLGIGQISDLELQKRMRNKKNTSIFDKNPKQSKEYLELEAEYNKRQAAKAPKTTPSAPAATPKPSATTPAPSGGGKPLFAPPSPKPQPSAPPQETFPPAGVGGTPIPGSPDYKKTDSGAVVTSTSGTGVNKAIQGVVIGSLGQEAQNQIQAQMSTPAALRQADKRIADATKTTAQKATEGQKEVADLVGKAAQSALSLNPFQMAKNLAMAGVKTAQTTAGAATGYASDVATAASNLITGRPGDRGYAGNRPDVIPVRPAPVNDSEKVLPPGAFRSGTAPTGTPSSGPQIMPMVPQNAPQEVRAGNQAANETPAAKRLRERLGTSMPNQGYNMPMGGPNKKAIGKKEKRQTEMENDRRYNF